MSINADGFVNVTVSVARFQSLLVRSEFVIWNDASVRWNVNAPWSSLFQRARDYGVQVNVYIGSIAVMTFASAFTFFRDRTCQYAPWAEVMAGIQIVHNDAFVREAVMPPILSCTFNTSCMCVENHGAALSSPSGKTRRYNTCHRFDQSALGIVLSKLYADKRDLAVDMPDGSVDIKRGDDMNWFKL